MTLQPALLSLYGRRGIARKRILPGEPVDPEHGMWARLARAIMARPVVFLVVGTAVLLAPRCAGARDPADARLDVRDPAHAAGDPAASTCSSRPSARARSRRPRCSSTRRTGSVLAPRTQAAIGRLVAAVKRDPEVAAVYDGTTGRYVDPSRRYEQVIIAGKHDYGFPEAQAFVHRLRGAADPGGRASRPATTVLVGGAPGQGVDFLHRGLHVLPAADRRRARCSRYLLLMRAFRSVRAAAEGGAAQPALGRRGLRDARRSSSAGASARSLFGLYQFDQVEGWIPIFLFAMLFGLSMDYEVFLVTRMREAWDDGADNATAVAFGLERTGRIITAAAIIMCAAFLGFVAGRIVGLQQFGLGLAVAIFVDATIVRCLLVPSLMAIFGRWNWWLPSAPARVVRVEPSPLEHAPR